MPRGSTGTYTQPAGTTAVAGATIDPTANNTLITDIGAELTNSLDRQGRSAMTADLPMGGHKVSNMADPALAQDAATKNYVDTTTVPSARTIATGTGLAGGGDLSANRTLALANTAVTPGSYTRASVTVDQQGRVTAASSGAAELPTQTSNARKVLTTDGTNPAWTALTPTANISIAPGGTTTFANNMSVTGTGTSTWTVTLTGLANANYTITITGAIQFGGGTAGIGAPYITSKTSTGFTITWYSYSTGGNTIPTGGVTDITIFGGL